MRYDKKWNKNFMFNDTAECKDMLDTIRAEFNGQGANLWKMT